MALHFAPLAAAAAAEEEEEVGLGEGVMDLRMRYKRWSALSEGIQRAGALVEEGEEEWDCLGHSLDRLIDADMRVGGSRRERAGCSGEKLAGGKGITG